MPRLRVIGPGRAGGSFSLALGRAGWEVLDPIERGEPTAGAAEGVDLLIIATPDAAIAEVAGEVGRVDSTVVGHLAGSLGLDVLEPHTRRMAVHPLVSMPTPEAGAERLLAGAWFAIAGDRLGAEVVDALGGTWFVVDDEQRAAYHAAATIASNHVVALLGQAERVSAAAGVPLHAYFDLVRSAIDNVEELGPAAALTGPAARGDWATIGRHLAALPPDEREAYEVMARAARRLVDPRA